MLPFQVAAGTAIHRFVSFHCLVTLIFVSMAFNSSSRLQPLQPGFGAMIRVWRHIHTP